MKTLADIRGIDYLRKLPGRKIYYKNMLVGVLEKIIADKKSQRPKKAIVKSSTNKLYRIKPSLILVENGRLILTKTLPGLIVKNQENWKTEKDFSEPVKEYVPIENIVNEIKKIRDKILKLDEKLIDGEIDLKTFKIVRKDLERKIQELAHQGREPIENLKKHLKTMYKRKMLLEKEVEKYRLKIMLKEVEEDEVKSRLDALKEKIKEIDSEINKAKTLIDAYEILTSKPAQEEFLISNEILAEMFEI